jgi:hypothetical protein
MKVTDKLIQGGAIVGLGQGIQITFIDSLRNLSAAMQVGNPFTHTLPSHCSLLVSGHRTINLEVLGMIHSHFRS